MLRNTETRGANERLEARPVPPHPREGILPNHPHHPPYHHPSHQPPHIRASKIRLDYDDATLDRIGKLYDDVEYIVDVLETCPPEIKLTLAMLLGIRVDLRDYPQEVHPMIRFETPFLTGKNNSLIERTLECSETEVAVSIYNACPPEQALLALAAASFMKSGGEA